MALPLWWTMWRLRAKSPTARAKALVRLNEQPEPVWFDRLPELADDPETRVRLATVALVGRIRDSRAVDLLVQQALFGHRLVAEAAANQLQARGEEAWAP